MADPTRGHVVDSGRLLIYRDQAEEIALRALATGAARTEIVRRLLDAGLVTWKMSESAHLKRTQRADGKEPQE